MDAPSDSQTTLSSIDSSLINTSDFDDDQSTQSLTDFKQNKNSKQSSSRKFDPAYASPIEKARFENSQNMPQFNQLVPSLQQPFIGFCMGREGKKITINQSKIKKAQRFFNDQATSPLFKKPNDAKKSNILFSQSLQLNDISDSSKEKGQQNFGSSFSVGFKTMGTGINIQINQQSNAVMKQILRQFQQTNKPTKTKKMSEGRATNEELQTNNFKTVVPAFKQKMMANAIANRKRPVTPKQRKIFNKIAQLPQIRAQKIKLQDLPQITNERICEFEKKWKQREEFMFEHKKSQCEQVLCYFCEKYEQKDSIIVSIGSIKEQILMIMHLDEWIEKQLQRMIQLIIFKLMKYKICYPSINIGNKQLHANKILLQAHRKCLVMQRDNLPPLLQSISKISSRVAGKHINLCIVSVEYGSEVESYYLQLTDGWSCVLAVISIKNPLFSIIQAGKKTHVGSKISIVDWNIHPICNIGDYHPNQTVRNRKYVCIQFNYNNSMPIPFNQKLGWPITPFTRQIKKYKTNGGPIPLIQGLLIRMFTNKQSNGVTTNLVQLLVQQKMTYLMKVSMPQQVSLVELFRLYYPYNFTKTKKLDHNYLQFSSSSRFSEIEDKQRIPKVTLLFKNRLLNLNPHLLQYHTSDPTAPSFHDIIVSQKTFTINNFQCEVVEKVQAKVLLQQYSFIPVPKGFVICKGQKGSCLRRIPKFYDDFQYQPF